MSRTAPGTYLHQPAALHVVLHGTESDQCSSGFPHSKVHVSKHFDFAVMQLLSTNCSKISDQKLLGQSGKLVLLALKACQGAKTATGAKGPSDRLYTAGFRALNSILATLQSQHGLSTAELLELLRQFFTHGVELSLASPVGPAAAAFSHATLRDTASASQARYRPPHARRRSSTSSAGMGPHTEREFGHWTSFVDSSLLHPLVPVLL